MNLGTLKIIPISQIEFSPGDRGRDDYGQKEMIDLQESMKLNGLIQPIAVYEQKIEGKLPYLLIGGGRRLLSAKRLMWKEISVRIFSESLSIFDLKALELYENIHRKNLSQSEEIKMTAELHKLLTKMKGRKKSSKDTGHSMNDTAKLLNRSLTSVAKDIKLHEISQALPELKLDKIKNKTTANKIAQRFIGAINNRQLAEAIEKRNTLETDSPSERLINSYKLGNFFENTLESESFGFVEIDPPYGIDLQNLRKSISTESLKGTYREIERENYPEFLLALLKETFRLSANNSWTILWFSWDYYDLCLETLKSVGYNPCHIPAIWKKGTNPGQSHNPDQHLGNGAEVFIYASKGDAKLRKIGRNNIFDFNGIPGGLESQGGKRIHPTERPKELLSEILKTFCYPKTRVLVPFLGSGNTLFAANENQMTGLGFDLGREFRDGFVVRAEKLFSQKELFNGNQAVL